MACPTSLLVTALNSRVAMEPGPLQTILHVSPIRGGNEEPSGMQALEQVCQARIPVLPFTSSDFWGRFLPLSAS